MRLNVMNRYLAVLVALPLLFFISRSHVVAEEEREEEHGEEGIHLSTDVIEEFAIETQPVAAGRINKQQTLNGEIALIPRNVVHVSSPVEGIVISVSKALGDSVEKGEILARLNSRELATARAELLAANSKAKLALATFEREKGLFEKKISAESDFLSAEQALTAANIDLESARHRLLALGISGNQMAGDDEHDSLTSYALAAATTGVVIEKHITKGELVGPSSRIFVIADLSQVWLELTVYQKDLDVIRAGLTVTVSSNSQEELARGKIDFISPIVDRETRSTTARVAIDNARRKWRPGMFVDANVTIGFVDSPVTIPRAAVQTLYGQQVVFVLHDDEFEVREVELGEADSTNVAINEGLSQGEVIATKNSFTLKAELQKSEFGDDDGH